MNINSLKPGVLDAAKKAQSAAELLEIAKAADITLSIEEAKNLLRTMKYTQPTDKEGELTDDELEMVAGGGCGGPDDNAPYGYVGVNVKFSADGKGAWMCEEWRAAKEHTPEWVPWEIAYPNQRCDGCYHGMDIGVAGNPNYICTKDDD